MPPPAPGRFFWKMFLGIGLLMGLVLATSVWLIVREIDRLYLEELSRELGVCAAVLRTRAADIFDESHADELQHLAAEAGRLGADLRITFVAADGRVFGDSQADPGQMEPHHTRPEVRQAMATGTGEAVRWSTTVNREMKYLALRIGDAERPVGVVRVALPVRGITARAESARRLGWRAGGVGLGAALLLALGLAMVWTRPIQRITETARSLSRGDLTARLDVRGADELSDMARSLNQMRDHLAAQLHTIDGQKRNLESLINALTEGVIVADKAGRIVMVNPAAEALLRLGAVGRREPERLVGRIVEHCVPHHDLQRMLLEPGRRPAGDPPAAEVQVELDGADGTTSLLARAAEIDLLTGDGEAVSGRMVVLTDVTELARMIQMKTDFVANASHELRTPLSVIRASVETLLQMEAAPEPATAQQFLEVIDRQTGRLEQLVADLLDLSRVESPTVRFEPASLSLREVLDDLQARFSMMLNSKGIAWAVHCPAEVDRLVASPHLLRLVLDNLIDNAIKFTEPGGRVRVDCRRADGECVIEVADTGCGIAPEDQPRVFERFFQVERARSGGPPKHGAVRGTGLGLSIVRHAVGAMGGRVELRSKLGEGTTVALYVPASGELSPGAAG